MEVRKCVHGLDSRFRAVCNKVSAFGRPRGAIGSATLPEVIEFLDAEHLQATYAAVGDVLGVSARALAGRLGDRGVDTGGAPIISSGAELVMRMTGWKARPREREPS